MAIHWQVKFKSLRTETPYTVSIYDDSYTEATPVQLTGSTHPFTINEDNNDNYFEAVRKQSGYIRIIDNGIGNSGNPFNWRDLIPSTDTDRFITLSENGNVVWQGYMQAQNFGSELYGNPQERELPVQCVLSVLGSKEIGTSAFPNLTNFASLLNYALSLIPSTCVSDIVVQGGADARVWLMKKFDWTVFSEVEDSGEMTSKTDVLSAMQSMCIYWGWCARIYNSTLYLLCPDDTNVVNFLTLTRAQLETLASGISSGNIETVSYPTEVVGDIFASTHNTDSQLRGFSMASVTSDPGEVKPLAYTYPRSVMEDMFNSGFSTPVGGVSYSLNSAAFDTDTMSGSGFSGSLCLRRTWNKIESVIRQVTYSAGGSTARINSKLLHNYIDGFFSIKGHTTGINDTAYHIVTVLAVMDETASETAGHVLYWNGSSWIITFATFNINAKKDEDFKVEVPTDGLTFKAGYVFVSLQGTTDGPNNFDITEFEMTFKKTTDFNRLDTERASSRTYTAKNGTMVKSPWDAQTLFATNNYNVFAPGIVMNPDNTYFAGWDYPHHMTGTTQPEQHLADRVAAYGSVSRRMIDCELLMDVAPTITPRCFLTIDGSRMYPVSISHDWRDEVLTLKTIEI